MELEAAIGHGAKVSKKVTSWERKKRKESCLASCSSLFFTSLSPYALNGADGLLMLYHLE